MDELDGIGHAYDVVFAIAADREGHIWIGSRDGLSQLRPRPFTTVWRRCSGKAAARSRSIAALNPQRTWISGSV